MFINFYEKVDGIGGFIRGIIAQLYYATKDKKLYKINIEYLKNIQFNTNFFNIDKMNTLLDIDNKERTESEYDIDFDIDDYLITPLSRQIYNNINFGNFNKCLPNIINVGVHIRRGDVYYRSIEDDIYRNKYYGSSKKSAQRIDLKRRFLSNEEFLPILKFLNETYGVDKIMFHIFSVGESHEFEELHEITNKIMYISDPDYQETYHKKINGTDEMKILMSTLIHCDILICSKSALSLSCALLSQGHVIFPKWNNIKCDKWLNFNNYTEIKNKIVV